MCSNHFCNKKVCIDCICNQKVCINHFRDKKVSKFAIRCPSQNNMFLFPQFYSDYPETFQAIQKLSRLYRNFLDHLENIQTIRKLSGPSGNFPDGLETSQCNFKGYAQKLSGRAKTFRMAMPRCHDGFCASAKEVGWAPCQ